MKNLFASFDNFVFVSPHLDDAIFSAAGLITKLNQLQKKLTLINVFTSPGDASTSLSAKVFLRSSGFSNPQQLYAARIQEDEAVCKSVFTKIINLNHPDALWRSCGKQSPLSKILPELNLVYPTYRFHIIKGKVSPHDQNLISLLSQQIIHFASESNTLVLGPLGIGNHVDHLVVREAIERARLPHALWVDVPYNDRVGFDPKITSGTPSLLEIKLSKNQAAQKLKLCQGYVSQFKSVFSQTPPKFKTEHYHFSK